MPERAIWIESASVPVLRPLAVIEYSIPSASAVSTSSSKTFGERVEPRPIAGPEPSGWTPTLLLVDAGGVGRVGDVDGDRDVGAQLEGRGAGAEQADLLLHGGDARHRAARAGALGAAAGRSRARRRRRAGCPSTSRRGASRRPASARCGSRSGRRPGPAPRPPRGRRRRCRCASTSARPPFCAGRSRAGGSACGRRRRGRGRRGRVTSTRWPTRICGSQPPIGSNQRKPFSSMWVTIRPISSMWPTIATSGSASPTRAIVEPMPS